MENKTNEKNNSKRNINKNEEKQNKKKLISSSFERDISPKKNNYLKTIECFFDKMEDSPDKINNNNYNNNNISTSNSFNNNKFKNQKKNQKRIELNLSQSHQSLQSSGSESSFVSSDESSCSCNGCVYNNSNHSSENLTISNTSGYTNLNSSINSSISNGSGSTSSRKRSNSCCSLQHSHSSNDILSSNVNLKNNNSLIGVSSAERFNQSSEPDELSEKFILSMHNEQLFSNIIQYFLKFIPKLQRITISQVFNGTNNCLVLCEYKDNKIITDFNYIYDSGKLTRMGKVIFLDNRTLRIPLQTTENLYGEIKIYPMEIDDIQELNNNIVLKFIIQQATFKVARIFNENLIQIFMDISSVYSSSALFFSKLSKLICKVFNSKYAGISILNSKGGFDTISLCTATQELENFSYELKKTSKNIVYYDDINEVFRNNDIIKKYNLKSYMEIPLKDSKDIYIGDIVLFGDDSINPNVLDTNILTFITNRTSIEFEKKKVSDELIIVKNLLDQSPSCSVLVDKNGNIIRKIGAFYDRLLGCKVGDNITKLDTNNILKNVLDKVCFENNNIIVETILKKENGEKYPAELFTKEIGDSQGNSNGIMIIIRDISDQIILKEMNAELQKKSELEQKRNLELMEARDQALAATKVKSQFLATISHEIRTPLNGVIGMAEMLLKTSPLNTEQHDIAETIFGSGELLLSITSDILDFSKIEASRLELEMIEFDFIGCFEGITKTIGVSINAKPIEIVTLIDPDIPHRLVGDPNRLVQILLNMGTNAVKYTDKGHIIFKVSVLSRTNKRCKIRILIEDSGIGIDENQRKHLFEPFHQIDASTTRKYGGSGLGLAISSKLAKLMGGSVLLEKSQPGIGSVFSLTLEFEEIGPNTLSTLFPDKVFTQNSSCIIIDNYDVTRPMMEKKFSQIIGGKIYGVKESVVKEFFDFIHHGKRDPNNPCSNIDFCDLNPEIKPFFDPNLSVVIVFSRFMDSLEMYTKYIKEFENYYPKNVIVALAINPSNFKSLPAKRDFLIIKKPISSTSMIKILNLINQNSPKSPTNPLLINSPNFDNNNNNNNNNNNKKATTPKKEKYDYNISPMRIDLNISGSSPKLNIYSSSSDEEENNSSLNLANIELINDPIYSSKNKEERIMEINENQDINNNDNNNNNNNFDNNKQKLEHELESSNSIDEIKEEKITKPKTKTRILLVDDNAVNRKVVKLQLRKLGYECDTANNGFEGFEMQKANNYDLIFMDLNMPECDGSTSSKLIRSYEETNNYTNRASIVGLSATYLHGSKDYCKSMGMDDFVVKPLKLEPLGSLVKKYLNHSHLNNSHPSLPKDFI